MNGQANIQRLKRAVQARRPIPDDIRDWLLSGLGRWEGSDDSLEVALGIVRDREALVLRDVNLRRGGRTYAGQLVGTGAGESDTACGPQPCDLHRLRSSMEQPAESNRWRWRCRKSRPDLCNKWHS